MLDFLLNQTDDEESISLDVDAFFDLLEEIDSLESIFDSTSIESTSVESSMSSLDSSTDSSISDSE